MRCLVSLLVLLALSGCSAVKPLMPSCDDPQPYQGSTEIPPLKVPEGVDQANTRAALRIPDVKTPAQPQQAGRCLAEPPPFTPRGQATAGVAGAAAVPGSTAALPASESRALDFGPGAGRQWETRLGVVYQLSDSASFEGGTTADFNSDYGFLVGAGWRLADRLTVGANLTYDQRHYHAKMVGDEPGEVFPFSGSLDSMGLMVDLTYNFMSGPLTPFIVGGVGWNWVDTNIATERPEVGCWWNPWYGYICTTFQDTKTIDGFGYQVGAGLRYDISEAFSLSGSYKLSWVNFPNATGTPSFGGVHLVLGWKF